MQPPLTAPTAILTGGTAPIEPGLTEASRPLRRSEWNSHDTREDATPQGQEGHGGDIQRAGGMEALVLNSASEAIWSVDLQGRTTFVNPAAATLTGWTVQELLGVSQHTVLRHSNKNGVPYDELGCPLCRAFRGGAAVRASEEMFFNKNGASFPVKYSVDPIHKDGRLVGTVLTFSNIAEHRMQQSNLVHSQKLESIGQLAAGIAHEINTPTQFVGDNTRFLRDSFESMSKMVSICDRLLQAAKRDELSEDLIREATEIADAADVPYLSEEIPKAIDQSLEGIDRIAKIVRAMKEFSHPDSGSKVAIDLNKAIESTVTIARNEWKYVAEMMLDLDPALPLVTCHPGDVNQVILNLVVNAAHAIGDATAQGAEGKGAIRVSTRREGEWVVIRIGDTGAGIPEAIRSRIFDPFFTTKAVGKGTGQGLAIAYSVVVEKHGGTIRFDTELRRGTTFIIHLPINSDTAIIGGSANETADSSD